MSREDETKRRLSQSSLFADIAEEIVHEFALVAEERIVPARNIIFRQGDQGDSFYIINSGSVRIFRKGLEGVEIELARLGQGDCFGEIALLTGEPRAGHVETLEETNLTIIYKEHFERILKSYPHISSIFFKRLHSWIVQSDLKIELQKRLIEYEKLSALGRLTANVAHEIRNPISVIAGFIERMKKDIPHGTKEKEYLDIISLEVKRLEEILREVLTFSSKPFFHKEKQDINKIVDECLDVHKDMCQNCSMKVNKYFNNVPHIYIDKIQVKCAINNLISNAIEAMPDGGTLAIATNEDSLGGKNYVAVKVTDTGIGISEDDLLTIYEPFFTKKITKKETGLGLPITKKIVEGHGGLIKTESVVRKGSTFTLYFPYRKR